MPKLQPLVKILVAGLLFFAAGQPLPARSDAEGQLREDVEMLCSESFSGRSFHSGGTVLPSIMIARRFAEAGLAPLPTGRYQCFRDERGDCGRNVVGVLKGRSREMIVIGAYYDGLGRLEGRLYPGADANASGVAMMLQLAERLAAGPTLPKTLVFVAFDAHHAGCKGASAFLASLPQKPLLMLSLDTVGSSLAPVKRTVPDYLIALGGERWKSSLDAAAAPLGITMYYDYYGSRTFTDMFYRNSGDQKPFLDAGIPSVMFTSGITFHTNRTADTPATLNYPLLRRRTQVVAAWLRKLSWK